MTQKQKKLLILAAAVLALAAIAAIVVPKIVEHQRLHIVGTTSEGTVRGVQDNWLLTNVGTSSHKRYSHIANVDPLEGYALDRVDSLSNPNLPVIYYSAEGADVPEYCCTVASKGYEEAAQDFYNILDGMGYNELIAASEPEKLEIAGYNTVSYWANGTVDIVYDDEGNLNNPVYDAEGNATYPQKYMLSAYCYVQSPQSNRSVLILAHLYNTEANEFIDAQTMLDFVRSAVSGIHYL